MIATACLFVGVLAGCSSPPSTDLTLLELTPGHNSGGNAVVGVQRSYAVVDGQLEVSAIEYNQGTEVDQRSASAPLSDQQLGELQEVVIAASFTEFDGESTAECYGEALTRITIEWSNGANIDGRHSRGEESVCPKHTLDGDLESVLIKLSDLANELEINLYPDPKAPAGDLVTFRLTPDHDGGAYSPWGILTSYAVMDGELQISAYEFVAGGIADRGLASAPLSNSQLAELQTVVEAAGFTDFAGQSTALCDGGALSVVEIEWSNGAHVDGGHHRFDDWVCQRHTLDGDLASVVAKLNDLTDELGISLDHEYKVPSGELVTLKLTSGHQPGSQAANEDFVSFSVLDGQMEVTVHDEVAGEPVNVRSSSAPLSDQQLSDLQEVVIAAEFRAFAGQMVSSCDGETLTQVEIEWSDGTSIDGSHHRQEGMLCPTHTVDGDLLAVRIKLWELMHELEIAIA